MYLYIYIYIIPQDSLRILGWLRCGDAQQDSLGGGGSGGGDCPAGSRERERTLVGAGLEEYLGRFFSGGASWCEREREKVISTGD